MKSLILRGLGILFILPSLFFQSFLNVFPGLPPEANWIFLAIGVIIYVIGALLAFWEKQNRDQNRESEEKL
jgi:tellurite resistance protein TehA-like permease